MEGPGGVPPWIRRRSEEDRKKQDMEEPLMIPDDHRAERLTPTGAPKDTVSPSSGNLGPGRRSRVRRYPLRSDAVYSLRDAANRLGISEGQLRRAVLMDHLPVVETDDDRQYVFSGRTLLSYIREMRPDEGALEQESDPVFWGVAFLVLFPLLALIFFLIVGAGAPSPHQSPPLPSPGPGIEFRNPDPY
jgi:hypothetical protein